MSAPPVAVNSGIRAMAALLAGATLLCPCASAAQDCPTAQSAAGGFVLKRDSSTVEVAFAEGRIVRTVLRSASGQVWLERTMFEGVFDLERLDRGRRSVYRPKTELARLFPLKVGGEIAADFEVEEPSGRVQKQTERLRVARTDALYIGACKYDVSVIERRTSLNGSAPQPYSTDYYAPALRMIIAKTFKNSTTLNKYDGIRGLNR